MKTTKLCLGLALLFAVPFLSATIIESGAADKIKFQLDWIIEGKHVPFYVARDRVFLKRMGWM